MRKGEKRNPIPKSEREVLWCKDCEQWLPLTKFDKDGKTSAGQQKFKSNRCHREIHAGLVKVGRTLIPTEVLKRVVG